MPGNYILRGNKMKICDDVNAEGKEAALDEKSDDVFFLMLGGKSVTDVIKTSRGDFKVKYPKQNGLILIGRVAAFLRGGLPLSSIDTATEYEIQKCAVLDVLITGGPEWFESAKKGTNFSWTDIPDSQFADEVYAKVLSFCAAVREMLKENKVQPPTEL